MEPIFDHINLLNHLLSYKQKESEWFLVILANPNSSSQALTEIYKNFVYLDKRTEDIIYFMPGYANMLHEVSNIDFSWLSNVVDISGPKGKLSYSPQAFIDTVDWLESYGYEYSESAELLFIKHNEVDHSTIQNAIMEQERIKEMKSRYHHWQPDPDSSYYEKEPDGFCAGFDLKHIISFNLDNLVRERVNLTGFFKTCNKVVREEMSMQELNEWYQYYYGKAQNNPFIENLFQQEEIKVFIAGSKDLTALRHLVKSALMGIQNKSRKRYRITACSFEDFPISFTSQGRQEDYMRFIRNEANYVIFILDSAIGGITHKEFDEAINCYRHYQRPKILVFNRKVDGVVNENEEIKKIIDEINRLDQYYTSFTTDLELDLLIQNSFMVYV